MTNPEKHKFENLFWITTKDGNKRLATINADPGKKVYTERLLVEEGVEYRTFDPYKSKLGASLFKKLGTFPFSKGSKILYLGAASGTTVSHVSDIIGDEGLIFAVEFSARSMRDLIVVAERRKNIVPVHADARFPEEYSNTVSQVDIVYEDVAQPFQAEILDTNVKTYLKDGGYFFLAVKSRSIDVTQDPQVIFKEVIKKLESFGLKIIETVNLEPYEKDHILIVGQK